MQLSLAIHPLRLINVPVAFKMARRRRVVVLKESGIKVKNQKRKFSTFCSSNYVVSCAETVVVHAVGTSGFIKKADWKDKGSWAHVIQDAVNKVIARRVVLCVKGKMSTSIDMQGLHYGVPST